MLPKAHLTLPLELTGVLTLEHTAQVAKRVITICRTGAHTPPSPETPRLHTSLWALISLHSAQVAESAIPAHLPLLP